MPASHVHSIRCQREQRFTIIIWMMLVAVGALLAAAHDWSSDRSGWSADDAVPVPASTPTMRQWLDQSQPSINGLVVARNNIAAAASHHDITATGAACQSATGAVATLRQHLPSPVSALNQSLQQAISSYTLGLPDCVSASRAMHAAGMQRAASFISSGDVAMQSALDILGDEPATFGVLIA